MGDLAEWLAMRFGDRYRDATVLAAGAEPDDGVPEVAEGVARLSTLKKPSVVSGYERLKRSVVAMLATRMCISAQQLAANVTGAARQHFPEDDPAPPSAVADAYVDEQHGVLSAGVALDQARAILAHEIGREPLLKREARQLFKSAALLDVEPTERGMTRIDEAHPYHNFKFLKAKPISALVQNPSQVLQIFQAEEERLVAVTLRLPTDVANAFERRLLDNYQSEGLSDVSRAWNEERAAVVEDALARSLLPLARGWTREWLLEECREALLRHVEARLTARVEAGPYQSAGMLSRNGDPDVEEIERVPRVLAVSNGAGDPRRSETVAVFLDEHGRFVEPATFDDLRRPSRAVQAQQEEARARGEEPHDARHAFVQLVRRRRPDVVVVNGFSPRVVELRDVVQELVAAAHAELVAEEQLEGLAVEHARVDVISTYDDVARLYQHSQRAADEFPELGVLGRYCIALARYAQSPVNEFAALGADLPAVQFDPAQRLLPPERLRAHMERAIVMLVNDIGVDIHAALSEAYTQHMLQFVAGLGPRKAAALVRAITSKLEGRVVNREVLVRQGLLTFCVWTNAISFLRIEPDALLEPSEEAAVDVLDSTRIHPEDYDFPRQMARDALNKHLEDLEGEHPSLACREIMDDPHPEEKLAALDLDSYAAMLYELSLIHI